MRLFDPKTKRFYWPLNFQLKSSWGNPSFEWCEKQLFDAVWPWSFSRPRIPIMQWIQNIQMRSLYIYRADITLRPVFENKLQRAACQCVVEVVQGSNKCLILLSFFYCCWLKPYINPDKLSIHFCIKLRLGILSPMN